MHHPRLFLIALALAVSPLSCYDELHFYRPPFVYDESHIARPGLMDFSISGNHGATCFVSTPSGCLSPLATCFPALCLPADGSSYLKFSLSEAIITWFQNFDRGLFVGSYVPFRSIHLRQYMNTKHNKKRHEITVQDNSYHGVADTVFYLGWAINYEETTHLDFVDGRVEAGVVLPTSRVTPQTPLTTVPLGYKNSTGLFVAADASLGVLNWLTCGIHGQYSTFLPHEFYGACGRPLTQHLGPAGIIRGYLTADHIILGFSFLVGYSFAGQSTGTTTYSAKQLPANTASGTFFSSPVCIDRSWSMHIFHLNIEYDCATYTNPYAPCFGFRLNKIVKSRNCVPTTLLGGFWNFMIGLRF